MKNESTRFLYASGIATGVIMSLVSVLCVFRLINYLETGGSLTLVVLVAMAASLLTGALITLAVNFFIK